MCAKKSITQKVSSDHSPFIEGGRDMRHDWEKGPDEFEEEFVEKPGGPDTVVDFVKDIPDMILEAGKEMIGWDESPEEERDMTELTADERLAKYEDLYEKGMMSQPDWEDKFHRYVSEKGHEQFAEDLESVGLSMDHLIDLSEDYQILKRRDLKAMEMKDELRDRLESGRLEAGPAQDLADAMLDEGEISKDTHSTISRTIEVSKKNS